MRQEREYSVDTMLRKMTLTPRLLVTCHNMASSACKQKKTFSSTDEMYLNK